MRLKCNFGMTLVVLKLVLLFCAGLATSLHRGFQAEAQMKDNEIQQLLSVVRNKQLREQSPEVVAATIKRLGEMRTATAVTDLIDLLTFQPTSANTRRTEIRTEADERYPAMDALFLIGKPALPALVKVVAANDEKTLVNRNAAHTILSIFRDSPSEGAEYLTKAAKDSPARSQRRVLNLAEKMNRLRR